MKSSIGFEPTPALVAISFIALGAMFCPGPVAADLPPGEPTFFAGNPETRQLAFRYRLSRRVLGLTGAKTGIYGLFGQSSFWYLDNENRGYTVESNFEPEIQFLADGQLLAKAARWWPGNLHFSLSYSHHSNGIDGDLSRSWNHLNTGLYLGDPALELLSVAVVGWLPFNVEASNRDIARYAGHGRISLNVRPRLPLRILGRTELYLASTFSFDSPNGRFLTNLETSLSFAPDWLARPPFPGLGPGAGAHQDDAEFGFFVQWFLGKGESLIEYRRYQNTLRFGLRLW